MLSEMKSCKRTLFSALLILAHIAGVNAQTNISVGLPAVTPPSPEAASLGKYGDQPVGMFTGHPNFTIDLYKVTTKHLTLPISLNYNVNGIKVNELSSNVGMSWALNCGGVISRTIYGFADFGTHRFLPTPSTAVFPGPDAGTNGWMYSASTDPDDTQSDAFNFNFNGYTGKFFIVPQGPINQITYKVVTTPYSNIQIQYDFSRTDWNFKLTTPDGVQYYFGGSNATEKTSTSTLCGFGPGAPGPGEGYVPTAWYLVKIQHPTDPSDNLTFTYTSGVYTYTTGVTQSETYWDNTGTCPADDPTHACTCGPTAYIYGTPTTTTTGPYEDFCVSSSVVNPVYLQSITDGKYNQLLFSYIPKTDANGGSLLSKITVNNNQTGQTIKSFNFTYQTATPVSINNNPNANNMDASTKLPRPFLTEVDALDNTGTIVQPYKFGYNDFSQLPTRLSFAQDYWGYYNGVTTNYNSSIAMPNAYYQVLGASLIANRNPDYAHAAMGMLNQITYPTGGYTTIQYEGNTTSTTYGGATSASNYTDIGSQVQEIDVTSASPNQTFTVSAPTTVTINATVTCNCPSGTGCPAEPNSQVWGSIIANLNTTVQTFDYTAFNTRGDCTKSTIITYTLQPGVTYGVNIQGVSPYQLSIDITAPSGSTMTIPGVEVANTNILQSAAGGMRVKEITDYDPVANVSSIKKYLYDPTSTVFPAQPTYYHHLEHTELKWIFGDIQNDCIPQDVTIGAGYHQFSSSSFIDALGENSSPVYYQKVTESLGENFDNGGTEYDFSYNSYIPIQMVLGDPVYGATAPPMDWRNGLLLATKKFKMVNGNQVPVQNKTMTYTIDPRNSQTFSQYVIAKVGNDDPTTYTIDGDATATFQPTPDVQVQDFNVAQVNYLSEWQYLQSETLQDFDLNGNPTVSATTNFYYDNPAHAMLTRTVTTDSKGETLQNVLRYPQDASSVALPTAGESSALSALITQGRIGVPIEQEKDRNNQMSKLLHNTYSTFSNGLTLPQNVNQQNGTGATAYTDYTINNYDPDGDILQATPREGVSQEFIWDYLTSFPIAKVLNADPSSIAYTSFEADGSGNWTIGSATRSAGGITGKSYYTLNSDLSKTGLNSAASYTVSYWSAGGAYTIPGTAAGYPVKGKTINAGNGSWTYYEHLVTGQSTVQINGSGGIDELRLYPSTAQMTTYTYTPMVGLSSQCDIANRVTYYEYDAFTRLADIKDQDQNVVKRYCYNYTGQPGTCNLPNYATPSLPVTVTNSTNESGTFTFKNTSTNATYTFSAGAGSAGAVIGNLPEGTYSLSIAPSSPSTSYYVAYTVNTSTLQETNATAAFASVSGNTPINVTLVPLATVPVTITNNTTEHMSLTFTNSGGSFTYINNGGTGVAGYIPAGTYTVSVTPAGATNTYPINFSVGGSNQSNWTAVTFSNITMNSGTAISMNPFPTEQVVVSNSTNQTLSLVFTDQVYGGVFSYSIGAGASNTVPGYIPASNYKITTSVPSPNDFYPITFSYDGNTVSSISGATWNSQTINSQVSITVSPVPTNQVVVTNTTNQTLQVQMQDKLYGALYTWSVPAGTSNDAVGNVPTSTYDITLSNSAPNSNYPIAFTMDGELQAYYGPVAYGGVPVSSQVSIQAKPAVASVMATNNTGYTIGLQFVNTSTGAIYVLGLPTQSLNVNLGSIPWGTYNVFMSPPQPSSIRPIEWDLGTASQTYYGEVEFGGYTVNSSSVIVQCYKDY
jgi:hypothetical protein